MLCDPQPQSNYLIKHKLVSIENLVPAQTVANTPLMLRAAAVSRLERILVQGFKLKASLGCSFETGSFQFERGVLLPG